MVTTASANVMEAAGLEKEAGDRVRLEAVALEREDAENGYLCSPY